MRQDDDLLDMDFGSAPKQQTPPGPAPQKTPQSSDFDFFDEPVSQAPAQIQSTQKPAVQNKKATIFDNDENDFNIMDIDFTKASYPKDQAEQKAPASKPSIFDAKPSKPVKQSLEFAFHDMDPSDFQTDWRNFECQ